MSILSATLYILGHAHCRDFSLAHMLSSFAELFALKSKFEEDKKKIAEMRANRRFKPY